MVSIVIPMYNVEKVIIRTLKSILEQEIKNYELIIIDDCSSDNTYDICKNFIVENKLNNIRLFRNKKNSGPSFTRNRGIDLATGDYLILFDADDCYKNGAINKMLSNIKKTDLVIIGIDRIYNGKSSILIYNDKNIQKCLKKDLINIYLSGLLNQPSNKMYNLDIIRKNQIYFDTNSSYGEDLDFNLQYFEKIKKCTIINEPLYIYYQTKSGLNNIYKKNELELDRMNFEKKIQYFKSISNLTQEQEKVLYKNYLIDRFRLYYRFNKYNSYHGKNEYLNKVIMDDNLDELIVKSDISLFNRKIILTLVKMKFFFTLRVYSKLFLRN